MNNSDISNTTEQSLIITPLMLVDESSSTEYYVGTSINGTNGAKPIWSIRKIMKEEGVWKISQYPYGDQNFNFVWNDRLTYTYL